MLEIGISILREVNMQFFRKTIPGGGGGIQKNCDVIFWICWREILGDRFALLNKVTPTKLPTNISTNMTPRMH